MKPLLVETVVKALVQALTWSPSAIVWCGPRDRAGPDDNWNVHGLVVKPSGRPIGVVHLVQGGSCVLVDLCLRTPDGVRWYSFDLPGKLPHSLLRRPLRVMEEVARLL